MGRKLLLVENHSTGTGHLTVTARLLGGESLLVFRGRGRSRHGYALVVRNTFANENREISSFYYIPKHI